MDDAKLECDLDLTPGPEGDIGLAFDVRNAGAEPAEIRFFRPFFEFELTVRADDGSVPVIQPPYNVRVQPETMTIAPGATVRIATPIRLRFDPNVPPSGGSDPMRWSLRHVPAPVRIEAILRVQGTPVTPCTALFDPGAAK